MNPQYLRSTTAVVIPRFFGLLLIINLHATVHGQIGSAPLFWTQPASQIGTIGGNASIAVSVSGTPAPGLQWQVSRNDGVLWIDLTNDTLYTGVTSATLSLTGMPLSLSGSQYRCVATNSIGRAASDAAMLTMPPAVAVTTLAGTGGVGSADGQGTGVVAEFNSPSGVAVDSSGNVYVADTTNAKVRKVSPTGVVTTLAGSGGFGSTDGTGTAASFNGPVGLAVDVSGNVFVADGNTIRKISPTGVVTTVAGNGSSGATDGEGTSATFSNPNGVAIDAAGNIYVADTSNNKIRKISPGGNVTTLAGSGGHGSTDGTGTAASFSYPNGVAVDAAGNVYVADTSNNRIRKVSSTGVVTTLAGSDSFGSTDGTGTAASFYYPNGVAVDAAGNVYVADLANYKIRKVSSARVVTTWAGSGNYGSADGAGAAASFSNPMGVAVDSAGNIYVADNGSNKIRKLSSARIVTTFAGSGAAGSVDGPSTGAFPSFNNPRGVAADLAGNIYVADYSNNKIRKVTPDGIVTTLAGSGSIGSTDGTGTAANFRYPSGVAVDAAGNVYVADTYNNRIRKVSPTGVVTTLAGNDSSGSTDGTGTAASFYNMTGVAVDTTGNVYVADNNNNKIRKVSPAGMVTTLAGSGSNGSTDGVGSAASFSGPQGVAIDVSGYLYVTDFFNNKVRKVSPAGAVTTLAGNGRTGLTDGIGTAASFNGPVGIVVDPSGNVYLADHGNNLIRKVNSNGIVMTLAGSLSNGSTDGTGTAARFYWPYGVAVVASGNVYVADTNNNKIRKITQPSPSFPTVDWAAPAVIAYGTALSSTQLNATASVPGSFVYTPTAGAVLELGAQTLSVIFTPSDTTNFAAVTATQALTVDQVVPPNQTFLQQLFPSVLGRAIDPGALSAYMAAMSSGRTRSQVYGDLIDSSEYSTRQIEAAIRLYYAALARPPDFVGLGNWSNALHGGSLTLTGAANQFASSVEFSLKYGNLDNTRYVQQLYRNVLGREADSAGLANWVGLLNSGASRGTILVGFSESDEFKADMARQVETLRLYYLLQQRMPTAAELQDGVGLLNGDDQTETLLAQGHPAGLSDPDYVQTVFRGFLRRDADAGTLDTFGAALAAGTVTHGSLVDTILNSTEFNLFVAPVSRLYLAALRRVPDAGGLDNWVAYVRAGNSLQVMADAFAASQEFINRYGAMSNQDYVAQLYHDVLGREADPAGLASWTALLDAGSTTRGQILIGFSESQEAMHLFAPTLRTFLSYDAFLNATPTQQDLDYWTNYLTTLTDQFRQTFLGVLGGAG